MEAEAASGLGADQPAQRRPTASRSPGDSVEEAPPRGTGPGSPGPAQAPASLPGNPLCARTRLSQGLRRTKGAAAVTRTQALPLINTRHGNRRRAGRAAHAARCPRAGLCPAPGRPRCLCGGLCLRLRGRTGGGGGPLPPSPFQGPCPLQAGRPGRSVAEGHCGDTGLSRSRPRPRWADTPAGRSGEEGPAGGRASGGRKGGIRPWPCRREGRGGKWRGAPGGG